ncbi:DUF2797 domain-containing protein [Leptospira sp. 96542]|nr:DUF2797 domain-containing protein [Leptospira sp. 96542]
MALLEGYIRMMSHKGINPVSYFWDYVEENPEKEYKDKEPKSVSINSLIGKKIKLYTNDEIRCIECGKKTKKSFNQGHCFVCFSKLAKNDLCILRPETCHFEKGTCREPEWGKTHCFKKHIVYFANSSGLKVGITKENPVSNRWVDQGARFGFPLIEVESRKDAGTIEAYLAKFLPDKTSWQKMVSGDPNPINLEKEANKFLKHIETVPALTKDALAPKWKQVEKPIVTEIQYPIQEYPKKIKSLKLNKETPINDLLVGIKGQYLLFESGVINIRSLGGLWVGIEF